MVDQPYDYLIVFDSSTGAIGKDSDKNNLKQTGGNQSIIHIYWASYDIKKKIVVTEWEYFIKDAQFVSLSPETSKQTKVANEDIQQKGVSLKDAIQHFNEAMYRNYIHNNLSFCLVTKDDSLLTQTLPVCAKGLGIKLPNHFLTYFDIRDEFKKRFKVSGDPKTLNDYLGILNLKETFGNSLCQGAAKSMLSLIDRLINDGHTFQSPKCLNPQHQIISENVENTAFTYQPKTPQKETESYEEEEESSKQWFIRLRGIPYSAREPEILDFLRGTNITLEDIALGYGSDGRFSGEAFVCFDNEDDFKTALSLNLSNMGSRYIEVFKTNEHDYNRAKHPHFTNKLKYGQGGNSNWGHLLNEQVGIVRMRGLPYSSADADIADFFYGYRIVKDGIKRGMTGGRPSGECYVVFVSKEEAHRAMERNMEKMGTRFIELFTSSLRELEMFLYQNFGNGYSHSRGYGDNYADKQDCTLMVVGLPFNVTKFDVLKFFRDFDLREHDVHLISSRGRFSGNASVTFANEREAQRALKTRNLAYMGNRYIELYEYNK